VNVIFFIFNLEGSGGTERMATVVGNELTKRGYKVFIVCLDFFKKSFFDISPDIELLNLKQSKYKIVKFIYNIISLRKILKRIKNGVLINVGTELISRSLPASIGIDFKICSWEHRDIRINLRPLSRLSRWLIYRYADKHILLSETDVDYAKNKRNEKKALCIPNPITICGEIVPSSLDDKKILCVSRICKEKGMDLLLNAWKLVFAKHSNWILQIVGSNIEDFHFETTEGVEIYEPTPSIETFYRNSSIYVLPSRTECMPLVALESKAFGLPIVSTNWGENVKELIENGINGFIVDNFDTAKMAEKINELIENESLRKQMGRASFESSKKYALDGVMHKWKNLFEHLTNKEE
jgi:glycosyltransferase involved in cell wall biosynthesis